IPSRDRGRFITADLYLPNRSRGSLLKPRPLLVNWHGSGFVLTGLRRTNALFCARGAYELGIPVLDANYRKAPEHPFPAAVQDAEDVVRWAGSDPIVWDSHNGGRVRFDPLRIAVSGFSSGATLALGIASVVRARVLASLGIEIRGVLGVYPGTDMVTPSEDKKAPREGIDNMDTKTMDLFRDCYVADKETRRNSLVSPVLAAPSLFPDIVAILTCEGDRIAPEGLKLAKRLEADGSRTVVNETMLGVGHGFDAGAEEGTLRWKRREEMYWIALTAL
ncbi:Alpha/beta hydrolase fold-3, partial [Coniella lustricola]